MGIFTKKKLDVEAIFEAINTLSDEEREALLSRIGSPENAPSEEKTEAEAVEENGAEETADTVAPEEAPCEEIPETEEDREEAPTDEEDEPTPDETAEGEDPDTNDAGEIAELRAEIKDLRSLVESLAARINADAENGEEEEEEKEEPFGIAAGSNGGEAREENEVDRCRKKYFNFD